MLGVANYIKTSPVWTEVVGCTNLSCSVTAPAQEHEHPWGTRFVTSRSSSRNSVRESACSVQEFQFKISAWPLMRRIHFQLKLLDRTDPIA